MTKRLFTTSKIVLLFTVILLAAVALGHVADVLDGAEVVRRSTWRHSPVGTPRDRSGSKSAKVNGASTLAGDDQDPSACL